MSRMFGTRINEFVLSADLMDEDTFKELLKLVMSYVSKHLDITYFAVLDVALVNDQPGLRTVWSSRDDTVSFTVDKAGGYTSQSAYAYGENKPIWVISDSDEPLGLTNHGRDMWHQAGDLPPYGGRGQAAVKTSVMHPLPKDGRAIGVVEFAAEGRIEPTPASLEEIATLAALISRAYQMYEVRSAQRKATAEAMLLLKEALNRESWRRLALPQLFVAHAGVDRLEGSAREGHLALVTTIREVVEEFSQTIKPVYWSDVTDAGNINEQVLRDIGESEFGLCYFSEPSANGGFQDNPNVLFEAGMMQALTKAPNALLRAWIPVREKDSPPLPFDIAAERTLVVARTDGKLDNVAVAQGLRMRLQSIIDDSRRVRPR